MEDSKIIDYTVCSGSDGSALGQAVNDKISEGWEPLGAVAVAVSSNGPNYEPPFEVVYAQALVKKSPGRIPSTTATQD